MTDALMMPVPERHTSQIIKGTGPTEAAAAMVFVTELTAFLTHFQNHRMFVRAIPERTSERHFDTQETTHEVCCRMAVGEKPFKAPEDNTEAFVGFGTARVKT